MTQPTLVRPGAAGPLTRSEWRCLAGLALLLVIAALVPPIAQPEEYHAFADARAWLGVPNAANVLSNLAFVAAGLALVAGLAQPAARALSRPACLGALVTAIGILFTAWGSGYYHAAPGNATLFWDRLPITVTFSGIIAIVLAQRVSARAARIALPLLLLLGPASVLYWQASGNVVPYGVLQIGAMAALLLIVLLTHRGADPFPWWWVIAGYAGAKIGETFDVGVFNATHHAISGHTLKHLLAALAVAGLAWPLYERNDRRG